jgi:hypothetical protein
VRLEELDRLKKSTSTGTRTVDLPAYSIVPQANKSTIFDEKAIIISRVSRDRGSRILANLNWGSIVHCLGRRTQVHGS